jgi:CheY-like chemotaxis protein
MFEPFFSTKGPSRGLGLAAVSGIVEAHHGTIDVKTEIGVGTSFTVTLPGIRPSLGSVTPSSPERSARVELHGTVLFADDSENFRRTAARLVADMGFQTIEVPDGTEAARVLETRADIDVLVMDWRMPPGGKETLERARAVRPGLPVVVISGYAESALPFERDAITTFLAKPFVVDQLREALAHVLAQTS